MGLFDVDYNRLLWQYMPVRLRKTIHYAWLRCLVAPVVYLHGLFQANRAANLYRLAHNSQVCYIEAALNDTFDNTGRRIYLSDIAYHDPLYIYEVPEARPVFLRLISEIGPGSISIPDPPPLYTGMETIFTAPYFIVNVPVALTFDAVRMRALIDLYRLPGRSSYLLHKY